MCVCAVCAVCTVQTATGRVGSARIIIIYRHCTSIPIKGIQFEFPWLEVIESMWHTLTHSLTLTGTELFDVDVTEMAYMQCTNA